MGEMKDILAEIVRCRELVARSPDDYPRSTMAGFAIAARQARDALPDLERQYVLALQARSVTVAVVGDTEATQAFRVLAEAESVELVVDVGDLYRELSERVIKSMGHHREWTPSQHSLTIQLALSKAVDLGFKEAIYQSNLPFTSRVVPTDEDAAAAVRDTIQERLGADLPRVFMRAALTQQAIAQRLLPEQPVGVLVLGARSEAEAYELLKAWPSASSVCVLTGTLTADDVVDQFRRTKAESYRS